MPTIPKKKPAPPPVDHTEAIFANGEAYTLAQLAEAEGLTVQAVLEFPHLLAKVGLDSDLPRYVRLLAHTMHRDMVDSAHYRLVSKTIKP